MEPITVALDKESERDVLHVGFCCSLPIGFCCCASYLDEYRSDRGTPPSSSASLILTSETPRLLPRDIHDNHPAVGSSSSPSSEVDPLSLNVFLLEASSLTLTCHNDDEKESCR